MTITQFPAPNPSPEPDIVHGYEPDEDFVPPTVLSIGYHDSLDDAIEAVRAADVLGLSTTLETFMVSVEDDDSVATGTYEHKAVVTLFSDYRHVIDTNE